MKKSLILLILLISTHLLPAQETTKSTQFKRDSLLKIYFQHRDTMTIRTWVNVVTANNYLEEIRKADSILLANQQNSLEKPYQMIEQLQEEIDSLTKQNRIIQNQAVKANSSYNLSDYGFLIAIGLAALFFLSFVILLIVLIRFRKKGKACSKEIIHCRIGMKEANDEILRLNDLKAHLTQKMEELENEFTRKTKDILDEKSFLDDDKILLENQLQEVKKTFDYEILRRMELESELNVLKQQNLLSQQVDSDNDNSTGFENSSTNQGSEIDQIRKALVQTSLELENEMNLRKNTENTLNNLLVQLHEQGLLPEGKTDFSSISIAIKSKAQLINDNKSLSDELEKSRAAYEKELSLKREIIEDLNRFFTKFGSSFKS